MQIKVFKAATMKEAMAAMKEELGDDAVILHSKKYKEGGVLGLGSKEIVEITAAVEESSLPQKDENFRPIPPKPSLFNRYKTSGTAQGIEQAEKVVESLSAPKIPRPTLVTQSDELSARVAAKSKEEDEKNFEDILSETQAPEVEEVKSDAEILSSLEEPAEEKISAYNEPVEEKISQPENSVEEKIFQPENPVEEKISQPENPVEEKISRPENSVEEKISQPENPVEEKISRPENSAEEKISQPENPVEEKISQPEQPQTQVSVGLTQEQLAQTQAMMFAQFNQMQMQMMQQAMAQAQAQVQAQLQAAEFSKMTEKMREARQQRFEAENPIQQPEIPVEEDDHDKIQKLEDEVAQMKALLAEVLGKESKKGGVSLHEALKRQEVDEEILTEMATKSGAGDTLADCRSTVARVTLSNYLTEHLNFSSGIKLNRHGVRIVALLGTTGVGKTTTLAKIAAKFVLENGVNAALITADTYRISAVEQLKTYSDILGLPLEIVYNPEELNSAIERHKHKELILIDTAGRSQQNSHQMRELEEFLKVNPRIEKHLVISATTKLTDAQEIMNKFTAVNPEKIIITKIDETSSLGMIMNLLRNQKISLSYFTTGQSVPDDIESASADMLTDMLLKKVQA